MSKVWVRPLAVVITSVRPALIVLTVPEKLRGSAVEEPYVDPVDP